MRPDVLRENVGLYVLTINRKEMLHTLEAKTKTRTQSLGLKHGGVTDESGQDRGLGRRLTPLGVVDDLQECTG